MKRTQNNMLIAAEGWPFILIALALSLITFLLAGLWTLPFVFLTFFVVYFFRNPQRVIPTDDNVISPADGRVIFVGDVEEKRILNRPMKRISIFMSPLNVHVNRMPVSGKVKQVLYNKGKFFPAHADKASLDNEQNAILIETPQGREVLFVQIAGWLARRIVNYVKVGETWNKGDLFGLIRFGSRMDVYLPADTTIEVKVGDIAKGGETVLAHLS